MYKTIVKPILDVIMAILGLIVLSPIFIVVFVVLLFSNQGQPFFYQKRPGKNEKIFSIVKFKTMNDKKDINGDLLPPEQRLTKLGLFLRKYSLDEIPQLLNVVKGDMSLVGPRPLHVRYLPRYNRVQKQRHLVKPGISGWAQVNGRNAIKWEEKFEYDVYYVNNISFTLDFKILLLTVKKVFTKEGIYTGNNEIVPDFMGTETSQE